ncbi:MAG TPA: DUF5666 domain-containing protein [Blastocatellia bacterium]|nr:DUF5666 domain-containing protein [Blastocatellia bacterium]
MKSQSYAVRIAFLLAAVFGLLSASALAAPKDEFEIKGAIGSLPSTAGFLGDWTVSGRTVHVTSSTLIDQEHGSVAIGALVEVKGSLRSDGSVDARKIEVESTIEGPGDDPEGEVKGPITALPDTAGFVGDWTVAGRTVHVSSSTLIDQEHGAVELGAFVEVNGVARADGSIDAARIEVQSGAGPDPEDEIKFKGTIQSFPSTPGFVGDWMIGGKTIHVTASTKIEQETGPVAVGAFAEVEGTAQSDGSIDARKVEVESNPGGDDGRHELTGAIESLPSGGLIGNWTVNGRTVHVTSSTIIDQEHGPAVVGAIVEVKGSLGTDGSLTATRIEVKSMAGGGGSASLKGTVQSLPPSGLVGDWTVSGQTVHVSSRTKIKQEHGTIAIGTRVKVKGTRQADGTIAASKIQVRDSQ